ncbi:transposase [uncultured Prevotella sp.]|uniref:transposase n=1 Tax=uncultured Prevotella sp. TaxID=159272 RepID=UPI00258F0DAA|nr:transposase [uncultured Prevotella sp.]
MSRSKEDAIAAGVQVRETQHKMKRRKPWHDYHRKGTYMVTLVVEGRRPVLGKLVMSAGEQDTSVELTALGKAIRNEEVQKISAIYKMVEIWKLCIMPDHIHMIVRIKEDLPEGKHLGHIVAGFKGGCSRAWWRMGRPCADAQGVVAATDAQRVVAATDAQRVVAATDAQRVVAATDAQRVVAATDAQRVVAATTPAASAAGMPSIFERGYNDLILLNDSQLDNWKHYLDDNPRRLAIKRLHPDFFTTLNYIGIAEWHCQIVGNRFLLDIPQKVAVIVHSAYSDKEYAEYKKEWLACGEAGGILVSAAIATREKEVMREAMNRGYRIIFIRENGFPPLYKPSGESFDACSNGRLLQICPWEYHMERRIISREQCLMLNRLAEEIAYHQ